MKYRKEKRNEIVNACMPKWVTNIKARQQIDDCGSSFHNITNLILTIRRRCKIMSNIKLRVKIPVGVVLRVENGTAVGNEGGVVVGVGDRN
jgi:hypothetical protein